MKVYCLPSGGNEKNWHTPAVLKAIEVQFLDTILGKIGRTFHYSGKTYVVLQFKMCPEDIFLQKFTTVTVLIIYQCKDIIPFLVCLKNNCVLFSEEKMDDRTAWKYKKDNCPFSRFSIPRNLNFTSFVCFACCVAGPTARSARGDFARHWCAV